MAFKKKLQIRKRKVKSSTKNNKCKKFFFSGFCTLLVTSIFVLILYSIYAIVSVFFSNDSLLVNMVSSLNKEWYLNTYFSDVNKFEKNKSHENDNSGVVVIDLNDSLTSRKNIANVINRISSQKPKLLCVDIIFSELDSYDTIQTKLLWKTIEDIKDTTPIVFVDYKGVSETYNKNHMIDSLNLEYGLCDAADFYKYTKYVYDTIPRISALIANKVGVDLNMLPEQLVINYCNKSIRKPKIDSLNEIDLKTLKDKIVIIGQRNAHDDMHEIPFSLMGRKQIPGIDVIAYEVSTLTSCLNDPNNKVRHHYLYFSKFKNFLFYVCTFFIYFSAIYFFYKETNKITKKNTVVLILILSLKIVLLFCAEFALLKFCFWHTYHSFYVPNIVFLTTSFLFADTSYQISEILLNKYYEK